MIASKQPELIMELIKKEYHIKGEGPLEYYLGEMITRITKDVTPSDVRSISRRPYTGFKTRKWVRSKSKLLFPLPPGDRPELDTS